VADEPNEPKTPKPKAAAKAAAPKSSAAKSSAAKSSAAKSSAAKSSAAKAPAKAPAARATAAKAPAKKTAAKPAAKAPVRATAKAADGDRSSLEVRSYSSAGDQAGDVRLPEAVFGQTPNRAVMHQAYVRQLNNARQGTAKTKRRGEVSGGGIKPYRQKGTGRARHGSIREPSMVGGGTVFGPQPRSFAQDMPRKMRRLALRSALSVKAEEGKVTVLEAFELEEPRTRLVVELLGALGVEDSALVVIGSPNDLVYRSFNNLPWAKVILARNLNLYDLFTHDHLVVTKDCLELLEETFSA
jgi:large subunit ribosomal protein L4